MTRVIDETQWNPPEPTEGDQVQDVLRDVLQAVRRALAANWDQDVPRVAVIEQDGISTAYVSTLATLGPPVRADVRGAVRAALAAHTRLAPYTNVVFLTRRRP